MQIQSLHLVNFKNYEEASFSFASGVNCITGKNGLGKTNVLDAVYYLSFCKSYFNPVDSQNIRKDQPFFVVQGKFERKGETHQVYCGVKRNQKKVFKINQNEYEKLSDHIGFLPVVMVSPSDYSLITEGSEERRKFIDAVISQYDKKYLDDLIQYNKALQQRNALLKQYGERIKSDLLILEMWNERLEPLAKYIYESRISFIEKFVPLFNHYYQVVCGGAELVSIQYESQLKSQCLRELFAQHLDRDIYLEYTSQGVHRDDLLLLLDSLPVKKMGSQGQQKTFLLALKLAQFQFLKERVKMTPILLLDELYEKLDESRVTALMTLLSDGGFGQIIITDTHKERIERLFERISVPVNIIELN